MKRMTEFKNSEVGIQIPQDTLEASIFLARKIQGAVDVLRPLVYQVWKDELWRGRFSSFGEYVESPEGLNKSQGYASKLRSNEEWRLESGLSQEQIAGIDNETLYLARKSGGTPEEIISKGKTLNRAELRQTQQEYEPHEIDPIVICKTCGGSEATHQ